jgi:3-phosphoinositide dependent protein kinase-1
VVLGTDKETGRQYAIKMLDKKHIKKQNKTQYVKTERDILAKCKHPNIIKLMSTFQDTNNLYYVLELAPGGELLTYIRQHKSLSMSCVPFYMAELTISVEYLHSLGIVHRDLVSAINQSISISFRFSQFLSSLSFALEET